MPCPNAHPPMPHTHPPTPHAAHPHAAAPHPPSAAARPPSSAPPAPPRPAPPDVGRRPALTPPQRQRRPVNAAAVHLLCFGFILDPYGGRMGSISPSKTPFPHRKGNLYNLQYYSYWFENGTTELERRMSWVRGLYKELEPYVYKNPRTGYVNYKDLDLGTNELEGNVTSYVKARIRGEKYFRGNFERLAAVKAMVDPDDFFRNEQSIPPLPAAKGWSSI